MRAALEYVAAGANHSTSCSASSSTGLVAYGAGKLIGLWDTEDVQDSAIFATLGGHQGEITKLKLFAEVNGRDSFISGDTTGELRIWQQNKEQAFSCTTSFKAHSSESVSALGVGPANGPLARHVLVGCADGSAKLWRIDEGQAVEVQALDLRGRLPLDFEIAYLPNSENAVLAAGCTDKRIQLWMYNRGKFEYATMLEGHENWIRALSFTLTPSIRSSTSSSGELDLLLASGSQDNYVRLWRIAAAPPPQSSAGGLEALDELERKLGEGSTLSTRAHVLTARSGDRLSYYNVTLDALLVGHESGVTNVHWRPPTRSPHPFSSLTPPPPPPLLSTSMDNSMVIWTPSSSGIWIPEHRFGSLGGHKLGLFGGVWGKDGKSVCCHGLTGGWERWTETTEGVWDVKPGVTGHFGSVHSVGWDQNGDYLLSVSSDQTSRIHAPIPSEAGPSTWAEISRPQIHGYDMTDAAFISPLRFISTADEKVTRVFDATGGFVESLGSLGIVQDVGDTASRPRGATVPALGLSNRAMGKETAALDLPANRVPHEARDAVSQTLRSKPTEEVLAMSTLWPEVEKVYGHGYELVTLATSHDGSLVATACKASNAEHAVVRINSTSTWDEFGQPLAGHTLTVTRIAFSHDDALILTCSRDRAWRLFKRSESGYVPWGKEEKAHSRMILDACWTSEKSFATASRDKTIKLWTLSGNGAELSHTIKLNETATAVDYARGLLVVGAESGAMEIYILEDGSAPKSTLRLEPTISHVGPVNRLAWNPKKDLLASCSDDRSLRVFRVSTL